MHPSCYCLWDLPPVMRIEGWLRLCVEQTESGSWVWGGGGFEHLHV